MNKIIILIVFLISANADLMWAAKAEGASSNKVQTISASALAGKIRQNQEGKIRFLLIDLRNPDQYAKGHLPGAVNFPLQRRLIPSNPEDREMIFYGNSRKDKGAMNAPLWAVNRGATQVYLLEDGFEGWTGEIES